MQNLEKIVIKKIILRLLKGQDYRIEVVNIINARFLEFCIDFFKKVVEAKIENKELDINWYKKYFLHEDLPKDEIAINSGLNMKTIGNMYNTTKKEVVIDASNKHFDELYQIIEELIQVEKELEIKLTIKFNQVSIELSVSESLIVINTLAVKRAAIRGGLWSSAGKRVEKPLMVTLCKLFGVDEKYYEIKFKQDKTKDFDREVDFYLISNGKKYKCEVKLMGKGNPESADVVFPRDSKILIADKLSDQNKAQLDNAGILWVELRSKDGWKKFANILKTLNIPYVQNPLLNNLNNILEQAI